MSIVVSVAVQVAEGEQVMVNVIRAKSVLAVRPGDPGGEITQRDVDLIDLVRAALDRLTDDVRATSDEQVVQLRSLIEGLAG